MCLLIICLVVGCQRGITPATTTSPTPEDRTTATDPATRETNNSGDNNAQTDQNGSFSGNAPDTPGTGEGPQTASTSPPARLGLAPQTPVPRARPRTKIRSNGVLDIVFDDLEFAIDPDEDFDESLIPDEIKALDGKTLILRGFILDASVYQRTGIEKFILIRDNQECCFGPTAKVYHNVWVEMDKGASTSFTLRPVEVKGKFSIRPWFHPADGKCYSVYHLQAESAQ